MKTISTCICLAILAGCADIHTAQTGSTNETTDSGAAVSSAPLPFQASLSPEARAERAMQHLRESLSRSSEGLVLEKRPDGVSQVLLKGRFQSASVLVRDASGKRHQICVDSPAAADSIFRGQP
jgi:hypothetical protein